MITDGQVHLWEAGGDASPSPAGRQEPLLLDELFRIMDANGVDRAVLVPPGWAPRGNAYSIECARAHPDRLKVQALVSMPGTEARDEIEALIDTSGVAGLRMFLSTPPGADYLAAGRADWLWPILAERGVPISVHAGDSLPVLARAARRHAGLKLCLDAFGLGRGVGGDAMMPAFDEVVELLAPLDNVVLKTGPIPRMSGDDFPFSMARALLRRACDAFGVSRIMYASDLTLLKSPYSEGLEFWSTLDFLSEADRKRILGENINDWLEWF